MRLFSRHPDDAALAALTLDEADDPAIAAHVGTCPRCQARRQAAAAALGRWRDSMAVVADRAFSAEDLDRQRRAILHRVARLAGPARVLAFPGRRAGHLVRRPSLRWVALAAAAGLALGVVSGQQLSLRNSRLDRSAALAVQQTAKVVPHGVVDDPLLREVEDALAGTHRPEAAALEALTPITYEVR